MRKLLTFLLAFSMLMAACGDSGSSSGGGFTDCDDVAQGGVDLLQDILDEVSGLSMEQFLETASTDEDPEFITKFQGQADDLDAAQASLGCTDAELSAFFRDNVDQLEGSGPVGALMVEAIQEDPESFLE